MNISNLGMFLIVTAFHGISLPDAQIHFDFTQI